MDIETVVEEVKGKIESLTAQGQKLAQISLDTLKQANGIVVEKFQTLVKTETEAAKDLYAAAKLGLDKALSDGIKAVASAPISYLPPADKFVAAFNGTVTVLSDAGEELYQTFKSGFDSIQGELRGKPVAKKKAPAKRRTRSAARKSAKPAAA
jgi:hypothetical protein